jgi:predicted cobalt transporter CbtA
VARSGPHVGETESIALRALTRQFRVAAVPDNILFVAFLGFVTEGPLGDS